jgi:hypothetical protein
MIGRAVEYAARSGKPLFFQLITDGSCAADPGTRNWLQDTNDGVTLFGYFLPTGAPKYVKDGQMQLGAFNEGQTVDQSTLVGGTAQSAGFAVFANYCNVANQMAQFGTLTNNALSGDQLKSVLVFQGQGT